jgi:thiosulfate reductase/polysulfide reductase chain A
MHNGQVQEMSEAIDNKAVIITVDPRFSTAASKSKYWLAIKPATDMALLLSWMNVIINEELYDKDYVKKYTKGFEELKKHVAPYTPEWAYGVTTIKPSLIRKTAVEMASASPAVIVHPGRHVTWYGDDSQRSRAIAMLNALLGSWGKKGGFYFTTRAKVPKYPLPKYPKVNWSWQDAIGDKYPLANEGVVNAVVDLTHKDNKSDKKIKGWIVNGSNLITTLPNQQRTIAAINELELLVTIDTMPAEITGYADVVLPECTYLERYDNLRVSAHRIPTIALRMPAAKPKYNSKPDWWIAKQLAEKLGIGKYFPWKTIEDKLDYQLQKIGSSLKEMQKVGVKVLDRPEDDPLYMAKDEDFEFDTESGKIELYSTMFEDAGFDPMPNFTAHPQPEEGFYRLNYGRAPMHTFGRTTNNTKLTNLMPENTLWVHPKVAKEWELFNGKDVWLKNQKGIVSSFSIKVRVTQRIRWDSVYMVHGFGRNDERLTKGYGKGISDTELMSTVMTDPVMGGTGMRGNFVTFLTKNPHLIKKEVSKKNLKKKEDVKEVNKKVNDSIKESKEKKVELKTNKV